MNTPPEVEPEPTPGADRGWQLRLLGAPALVRADGLQQIVLSPKDAALLAITALDGPIAPEHLAARLWPAASGKAAHANLRQRLFRLRRHSGLRC